MFYLPVVCAGGLGKDSEWRRRRTRTGVSAVWSLDSTFSDVFCSHPNFGGSCFGEVVSGVLSCKISQEDAMRGVFW
jgi:hypothetical protein